MATQLIHATSHLPTALDGCVVTIGNFDGVHLGHQHLLAELVNIAHQNERPSLVITFEPHPYEFFMGEKLNIPRLTRLREKYHALSACNIDYMLVLPFNQHLAQQSAEQFVDFLHNQLHPSHVMIGDDFRFGANRQGDIHCLTARGHSLGFKVTALPTVEVAGERVSSTRVRQALQAGDHDLVKRLLGRPYSMMGHVQQGRHLGAELGFRTANIALLRRLSPVHGIYTVYVKGVGEDLLPGVASVGTRPSVDGSKMLLEVHLLDFNQTIYRQFVEVIFCEKLREEAYFPTLQQLSEQIAKDVEQAKNYFRQHGVCL